jgi:hypothetical protein
MEKKTKKTEAEFNFKTLISFALVCIKCGTTEQEFNEKYKDYAKDTYYYERLKLIYRAVNNERKPDFTNPNEQRWWSYHSVLSSGVGFAYSGSLFVISDACVGVRLWTFSQAQNDHINKYFEADWIGFKL